ncbi:MAG TPA: response regulator transcription factor [Chitinophagaceae bacterium]|nr:response regulator transcription factor [Chitinophagaceae bacterium]
MLSPKPLAFMIADDHPMFRKGLTHFLQSHYAGCSVHETENGKDLCEACKHHSYDIIFIDVRMPQMDGADATLEIKHQHPQAKIIAISMYEDETHILEMFKSGASAYLVKTSDEKEITDTVENVLKGLYYVKGRQMDELLQSRLFTLNGKDSHLVTEREKEILLLLCEGFSSKQIANKLYLSIKTVENHRTHLLEKTHVHNTAGLVMYAIKKGWI